MLLNLHEKLDYSLDILYLWDHKETNQYIIKNIRAEHVQDTRKREVSYINLSSWLSCKVLSIYAQTDYQEWERTAVEMLRRVKRRLGHVVAFPAGRVM
jgi:hypothetical protein